MRNLVLLALLCFPFVYGQWHHLTGSQTTETYTNYTAPHPGGLNNLNSVLDSTDRYLYLFGGNGRDVDGLRIIKMYYIDRLGRFNDIWKYDLMVNVWEHIFGNQSIMYRNYNEPYPGGLSGHAMVLDSTDRYLYVFGGLVYDSSGSNSIVDVVC